MADYRKLYHLLFNQITEVIEQLQKVQQMAEHLYTEAEPEQLAISDDVKEKKNPSGA